MQSSGKSEGHSRRTGTRVVLRLSPLGGAHRRRGCQSSRSLDQGATRQGTHCSGLRPAPPLRGYQSPQDVQGGLRDSHAQATPLSIPASTLSLGQRSNPHVTTKHGCKKNTVIMTDWRGCFISEPTLTHARVLDAGKPNGCLGARGRPFPPSDLRSRPVLTSRELPSPSLAQAGPEPDVGGDGPGNRRVRTREHRRGA